MDKTNKTKNLAYCALFTALIAVGAFIRVPVPVVPFTLQYLFTMLAGLLLGPRLGTIAVGTYVLLGLVGLPIFTQGGGFWYVFQPSFGYLIGFCVGTFVTGWLAGPAAGAGRKEHRGPVPAGKPGGAGGGLCHGHGLLLYHL